MKKMIMSALALTTIAYAAGPGPSPAPKGNREQQMQQLLTQLEEILLRNAYLPSMDYWLPEYEQKAETSRIMLDWKRVGELKGKAAALDKVFGEFVAQLVTDYHKLGPVQEQLNKDQVPGFINKKKEFIQLMMRHAKGTFKGKKYKRVPTRYFRYTEPANVYSQLVQWGTGEERQVVLPSIVILGDVQEESEGDVKQSKAKQPDVSPGPGGSCPIPQAPKGVPTPGQLKGKVGPTAMSEEEKQNARLTELTKEVRKAIDTKDYAKITEAFKTFFRETLWLDKAVFQLRMTQIANQLLQEAWTIFNEMDRKRFRKFIDAEKIRANEEARLRGARALWPPIEWEMFERGEFYPLT